MSTNTREALNRLIAALEHHYDAAQAAEVLQETALDNAEELLLNAFFTYDDALFTQYGVELPFEILDEDYDADADEADDLDDPDGLGEVDGIDNFDDDFDDDLLEGTYDFDNGDDDDDDEEDD